MTNSWYAHLRVFDFGDPLKKQFGESGMLPGDLILPPVLKGLQGNFPISSLLSKAEREACVELPADGLHDMGLEQGTVQNDPWTDTFGLVERLSFMEKVLSRLVVPP